MPGRWIVTIAILTALARGARPAVAAEVPAPSKFLGITVGADRTLAHSPRAPSYSRAPAAAPPRVAVQVPGQATRGEDMLMAILSSEANIANLPRLKEVARRL